MKPALVSFHIDRLVGEGYLLRQPVPGDRRKTALVLTAQAQPIVAEGRELQRAFADRLAEGLSAEDLAHFRRCVAIFDRNIEQIRAENPKERRSRTHDPATQTYAQTRSADGAALRGPGRRAGLF